MRRRSLCTGIYTDIDGFDCLSRWSLKNRLFRLLLASLLHREGHNNGLERSRNDDSGRGFPDLKWFYQCIRFRFLFHVQFARTLYEVIQSVLAHRAITLG